MKRHLLFSLCIVLLLSIAAASTAVPIGEGPVELNPDEYVNITPENSTETYEVPQTTALGALDAASILGAFDYQVTADLSPEEGNLSITSIAGIENEIVNETPYAWTYWVNDEEATTGPAVTNVTDGDNLTYSYGPPDHFLENASYTLMVYVSVPGAVVNVTPTPTVNVTPTPTVNVTPTPTVNVTPTPTVNVTPTAEANVTIVEPMEGAALPAGNVTVSVNVTNFTLVEPTGQPNVPGEGHLHYYLDAVVPTNASAPAIPETGGYVVSTNTSSTWENVTAGAHNLSVQLVNNDHTPVIPLVADTVNVTVSGVTPTPTVNVTPTPTVNVTPTPTVNVTPTPTVNVTPTPTVNVTPTPTVNVTPTPTVNVTPTPTVNVTPTPTVNVTPTPTVNVTPTPTVNVTPTPTVNVTPTPTVNVTPTPTVNVTPTPTVNVTPTPTVNVTPTPTVNVTPTPTVNVTPTPTVNVTPTPTVNVTPTPTVNVTPTPTVNVTDEIITGLSGEENLTTFADLVNRSTIGPGLDANRTYIVCAPTDDAFDGLGNQTLSVILNDTALLDSILGYHIIQGDYTLEELVMMCQNATNGQITLPTVEGSDLNISLTDGDQLLINNAVVVTQIQITNKIIVYVIDSVLIPPGITLPTPGPTPTPTVNVTPTPTVNVTPTPTVNVTPTPAVNVTPTPTVNVTPTPTVNVTPTLPPAVGVGMDLELYDGWNFVSIPRPLSEGNNTAIAVFGDVDTGGRPIYTYAPATGFEPLGANTTLEVLEGYWVYSNGTATVRLTFSTDPVTAPAAKALSPGWNAIGFSDLTPLSANETLASVEDAWVYVVGYDAENQNYQSALINGQMGARGENQNLFPAEGYWLFVREDGTLAAISA